MGPGAGRAQLLSGQYPPGLPRHPASPSRPTSQTPYPVGLTASLGTSPADTPELPRTPLCAPAAPRHFRRTGGVRWRSGAPMRRTSGGGAGVHNSPAPAAAGPSEHAARHGGNGGYVRCTAGGRSGQQDPLTDGRADRLRLGDSSVHQVTTQLLQTKIVILPLSLLLAMWISLNSGRDAGLPRL